MTGPAKDAYHAYHVALGARDAPAFERIPVAEQQAWCAVIQHVRNANAYVEHLESRLRLAEAELAALRRFKTEAQAERTERAKQEPAAP